MVYDAFVTIVPPEILVAPESRVVFQQCSLVRQLVDLLSG